MKKLFNAGWAIVLPSKKILHFLFVICISALLIPVKISAQPGALDLSFNSTDQGFGFGDGANSIVSTTAIQADGKIIIGGYFTSYNGTGRNRIARLNTDGSLDATFNPGTGADNIVYTTAIQADGKIIIGGVFTSYNGTGRNRIARVLGVSTSPLNDDALGAILLTVGSGCSGSPYTNAGATQSGSEPFAACHGTAGYKTVWYKFSAPASGNVRASTDYSGGTMGSDSRLALFSATDVNDYGTFSNIACDDDNGSAIAERSVLYATGLTPGNTYYIQVDGKDGSTATGTFCLTVDEMTSSMISTSTACAAGQPLTAVNDNYTGWLSATDASSKLVALIKNSSGGATTSTYTNNLNVNAGPVRTDTVSGQKYLDRNFSINNASVSNVNVQFFFLNTELAALQAADPGVILANLQVTRQTGAICDNDFVAANGTNSSLAQTGNGTGTGYSWVQVTTPGFSKFFLHTKKAFIPVKTFLQGVYNTSVGRHKDVTTTWRDILNANALNQPFNVAPFNYAGTESVSAGFFTSTAGVHTDVVDWVLLELRDAATPSTVIARRAAMIREDGRIVDHQDTASVAAFRTVPNGNYHLMIRHRNHLPIRTSAVMTLDGTMGFAAPLRDFTTDQATAFQNPSVTSNTAMKDFGGGVFGMWGGNVNSDGFVRVSGLISINDYLSLLTSMGNNPSNIISNVYNKGDLNMDGTVRASGLGSINDYLFLLNALNNNPSIILSQHQ